MNIGDLVKDLTQPTLGTGIVIRLCSMEPGYQGRFSGCVAMFGDSERRFVGRDNAEVISESR